MTDAQSLRRAAIVLEAEGDIHAIDAAYQRAWEADPLLADSQGARSVSSNE